ncbi:hypothetical protein J1614_001520 [Plenodomus biglobosus]|nr:hypothetical protein J1614_001520 [Plenodomus biglobosus]
MLYKSQRVSRKLQKRPRAHQFGKPGQPHPAIDVIARLPNTNIVNQPQRTTKAHEQRRKTTISTYRKTLRTKTYDNYSSTIIQLSPPHSSWHSNSSRVAR